jgi:hypothetical protein
MKYFFCKLIPPRRDFVQTITPAEGQLMQEHGAYWKGMMDRGLVAAFGLVGDPKGAYGVGILTLDDDGDAQALTADDPTIRANAGFSYEIYPMPRAVTRP